MAQPDSEFLEELEAKGYRIISEIGRGGMGVVYRGRHMHLNTDVAVKAMAGSVTDDFGATARFNKEMTTMSSLTHPAIVRVTDGGMTRKKVPYFVMEYVKGPTLETLIRNRPGAFSVAETVEKLAPVADALDYLHNPRHPMRRAGTLHGTVVHRDVKPANIIINKQRGAVLTDFGISHIAQATRLTQEGMSIGTEPYMAPELFEPVSVDTDGMPDPSPTSDLYAFALIALEMLTKKRLYDMMARGAWNSPHRSMEALVGAPYLEVFSAALSNKPRDRYSSATELLQDLQRKANETSSGATPQPKTQAKPQTKAQPRRRPQPQPETQKAPRPATVESSPDALGGKEVIILWATMTVVLGLISAFIVPGLLTV